MHPEHHRPTNLEPRGDRKAVRDQDLNNPHGATFTLHQLFPFSLLGKALQWFHSQPAETVQNWNALMKAFMKEYYSPGKTQSLNNKIATLLNFLRRLS
jgi:hypothetical protein